MILPHRKLIKPPVGQRPYRGHRLSKGLVGCWLMNEGGGSIVQDLSGNGLDATLGAGAAAPTWVAGNFGYGISFDGGDNLDMPSKVRITPNFSLVFWEKATAEASGFRIFLGEKDTSQNWIATLGATGALGVMRVIWDDGTTTDSTQGEAVASLGVYSQWVVTYSDPTINFYQNGNFIGTGVATGKNFDFNCIGEGHNTILYNGVFDHFIHYNRALSASEVALLYREPFCMFYNENQFGILGSYTTPVGGNAGIMTCNTGYWGSI